MASTNHTFFETLSAKQIILPNAAPQSLSGYPLLIIDKANWSEALQIAKTHKFRFAGIWAQDLENKLQLNICIENAGKHIFLRVFIDASAPQISSATPYFPAANRLERHTHDMFGIVFINHPEQKRWTRHKAWNENQFPLRKNFDASVAAAPSLTPPIQQHISLANRISELAQVDPSSLEFPLGGEERATGVYEVIHDCCERQSQQRETNLLGANLSRERSDPDLATRGAEHGQRSIKPKCEGDIDYPFIKAHGSGVFEIPVGPVHASIIEPGHFRFQAAGEDVINLEERLGYTHKGIEKIAEGRNVNSLLKLAGRISGDSTVANTWATCRAYENAYNLTIPKRASFIRAIMCERERIANHLGDFAAICNDVGFSFPYYQFMRIKELWLRSNAEFFGHRLMMDCVTLNGVSVDISEENKNVMLNQCEQLKKELTELYQITEDNSSLHDRLKTTGILSVQDAISLGCLGFVGRASGHAFDLRHDAPYSPYNELETPVTVPTYKHGDVLARTRIRAREILISLELLHAFIVKLPDGAIQTSLPNQIKSKANGGDGVGLIEGWRGEVLAYVSFDENDLVSRYFLRDPSWFSWPALEQLIHNNIVPDFPVCNKSINGSYSGVDL